MEILGKQEMLLICVNLNYRDVLNFSVSCRRINEIIYKNEIFWINKLAKDFDFIFYGKSSIYKSPWMYYKILNRFHKDETRTILFRQTKNEKKTLRKMLSKTEIIKRHKIHKLNDFLVSASSYYDVDLIEYFITKGASKFNHALIAAIKRKDRNIIDFLISKGNVESWKSGSYGITIALSENGFINLLNFFIKFIKEEPIYKAMGLEIFNVILKIGIKNNNQDLIKYASDNGGILKNFIY
jgi:hypothetical protein